MLPNDYFFCNEKIMIYNQDLIFESSQYKEKSPGYICHH